MNIYLFTENTEIKQRIIDTLLVSGFSVESFCSLQMLKSSLEINSPESLIYHLDINKNAESEFETIQKIFGKKINTLVLTNTPNPEQGVRLLIELPFAH